MRKGTYYIVRDGWGGQHGTNIEEVKMTKQEYLEVKKNPFRGYFITNSYESALYYTMD